MSREKQIIRTSLVGILANLALAGFKAAVGLLAHSIAIVLDAVNNLSDALSSVITVIGARLAGKPADKEHPYGHGRYEYISAAVISALVLYAGITALVESVRQILRPEEPSYTLPTLLVVGAAVAAKLLLGRYVKRRGQQLRSDSLVNAGRDALMDAVISASTLAAAVIYLSTGLSLEAWLGVIISLVIIRAGIGMFRDTGSKILGERVDSELALAVKETICRTEGVEGAYDLILNSYGPDRWLGSVHIEVPDYWTADRIDTVSREITQRVAEENHVLLTAIGVYSRNSGNDQALQMRTRVTEAMTALPYVLQLHGFYCDPDSRTLRFDLVIDFLAPDGRAVYREALRKVQEMYPDYQVTIQADSDFSD